MHKKYSFLSKNILLFSLSGFIPKILSFILIPIYTGYLTEAEYGISDLLTTTQELLIPVCTLVIYDAAMRFAMDKAYDRREVFSISMKVVLGGTALVAVGAAVIGLLDIPGIEPEYLFFLVVLVLVYGLNSLFSRYLRAIDKVHVIVVGSILHTSITLGANILFLVVFQWHLTGFLIANVIGMAIALVYEFFAAGLHRHLMLRTNPQVRKEMIAFSFPLVFSALAWWINNASDRYILTWIDGVAVSGLYAIAYKIPNLLAVFQNIFSQAWSISAIKEFDPEDRDGFIGNMYNSLHFAMMALCSLLMLLNIPVAYILYSNDFFQAWKFVPPLLISVIFNAMYVFISSIFNAVKDTKTVSVATVLGAAVNTVCNFVLIYYFGAYGAAIATMLGYGVTSAYSHLVLRKHIRIRIKWWRDLAAYGALLLQMVVAYFGWKWTPVQLIFTVVIVLLYWQELRAVLKMATQKLKKLLGKKAAGKE